MHRFSIYNDVHAPSLYVGTIFHFFKRLVIIMAFRANFVLYADLIPMKDKWFQIL